MSRKKSRKNYENIFERKFVSLHFRNKRNKRSTRIKLTVMRHISTLILYFFCKRSIIFSRMYINRIFSILFILMRHINVFVSSSISRMYLLCLQGNPRNQPRIDQRDGNCFNKNYD